MKTQLTENVTYLEFSRCKYSELLNTNATIPSIKKRFKNFKNEKE